MSKLNWLLVGLTVFFAGAAVADSDEADRKSAQKSAMVSVYNESTDSLTFYSVKGLSEEFLNEKNDKLTEKEREELVSEANIEKMIASNNAKKLVTLPNPESQAERANSSEACYYHNFCYTGWFQPVFYTYTYYVPRVVYAPVHRCHYYRRWGCGRFGFYGC